MDLQNRINIRGIATQGRPDYEQWVESYYIQHSIDGENWIDYYSDRSQNSNSTNAVGILWESQIVNIGSFPIG